MKQRRKNNHYFLLKVSARNTIRLPVKARNANATVILSRTLQDVLSGSERGMAVACANAQCALRENGNAFPHPVFMAEFTDNRAYIVDKLDKRGVPKSCVVYAHSEGKFQKQFDTKSKNQLAKMSGLEKRFILTPVTVHKTPGKSGTRSPLYGKKRSIAVNKGSIARALRAGLVLDPKAA